MYSQTFENGVSNGKKMNLKKVHFSPTVLVIAIKGRKSSTGHLIRQLKKRIEFLKNENEDKDREIKRLTELVDSLNAKMRSLQDQLDERLFSCNFFKVEIPSSNEPESSSKTSRSSYECPEPSSESNSSLKSADELVVKDLISLGQKADNFHLLGLGNNLISKMYQIGYIIPLEGQKQVIRYCLEGHNIVVQGPRNTGKTTSCIISLLDLIDLSIHQCQGLILAPTPELMEQIRSLIRKLEENINILCLTSIEGTEEHIKDFHVVIGTPRAVYNIINKKFLVINSLKVLIVDRLDENISRGFKEEISEIFGSLDKEVQVIVIFDKTSADLKDFVEVSVKTPSNIAIKKNLVSMEDISHFSISFENEHEKLERLISLYEKLNQNQGVIYCNSKKTVFHLSEVLAQKDFNVCAMHGDLDQVRRNDVMLKFRQGVIKVIIGTDLMAGRVDAQHVSILINYDLPQNREDYAHRIARDKRFHRRGIAINFVCKGNNKTLKKVEKYYRIKVLEMPMEMEMAMAIS